MTEIQAKFELKDAKIEEPTIYLGAILSKMINQATMDIGKFYWIHIAKQPSRILKRY